MEYDNNLRGVLFKNDRKETANHPDYKGAAEIDDVEFWLSAWIKEGKSGKFMSLSFTPKEQPKNPHAREPVKQTRQQQREPARDKQGFDDMDEDIPW